MGVDMYPQATGSVKSLVASLAYVFLPEANTVVFTVADHAGSGAARGFGSGRLVRKCSGRCNMCEGGRGWIRTQDTKRIALWLSRTFKAMRRDK